MAFETLEFNFLRPKSPYRAFHQWPEWLEQSPHGIESLLSSKGHRSQVRRLRGSIDLVAGGPPCQGFSVGGSRKVLDPRNDLPRRFVEVVGLVRPRVVLIENVEGFDRPFASAGRVTSHAEETRSELRALGYTTAKMTVRAEEFGVPQLRRRVIIFATRERLDEAELDNAMRFVIDRAAQDIRQALFPNSAIPIPIGDAISDLMGSDLLPTPDAPKFTSRSYSAANSEYSRLMRAHVSGREIPDSHRMAEHSEKLRTFFQTAQASPYSGRLPRQFLLSCNIMSRKKFLLDPSEPASTITSHPDEFIHFEEPRIITLREAARIQSFPDAFQFKGRYTLNGDRRGLDVSRCAQIGNAIPPLMAKGLGDAAMALLHASRSEIRNYSNEYHVREGSQLQLAV
jgi:DNA (cytosine-5)-methyltransferase 1